MRIKDHDFFSQWEQEDDWALIQKSILEVSTPPHREFHRTVQDYSVSAERLTREAPCVLPVTGSALPDNETYNPSDDNVQFGTLPQHAQLGEGFIHSRKQWNIG